MMVEARFKRWLHCLSWFFRPWKWSTEAAHSAVDVTMRDGSKFLACTCGEQFGEPGGLAAVYAAEWRKEVNRCR